MTKLEMIVKNLIEDGKTKKDFCKDTILEAHPEFINMSKEEIEKKSTIWSLESSCVGIALDYLGFIKDKHIKNYLSQRSGLIEYENEFDPNSDIETNSKTITFRGILNLLPE